MNRALALLTIVAAAAGCGAVAPDGETGAAYTSSIPAPAIGCTSGYFEVDIKLGVSTSTVDPWGAQTGVVVVYGDDPNMVIYGFNRTTQKIVWFKNGCTAADVVNFERYPQSERFCGGGTNNPGGGSGKGPPDPRWLGQCAPDTISNDAFVSWWYGPYDDGNKPWCNADGSGGCVPQTCKQLGYICDWEVDNCGQDVYCGACRTPPKCPCGGVAPDCRLCQ
jgi:hypothetical protein